MLEEGATKAARHAAQLAGRMPKDNRGAGAELAASTATTLLAGPDDTEHPDVQDGLQARLSGLAAKPRFERLLSALRQSNDWEGMHL